MFLINLEFLYVVDVWIGLVSIDSLQDIWDSYVSRAERKNAWRNVIKILLKDTSVPQFPPIFKYVCNFVCVYTFLHMYQFVGSQNT